MMLKSLQLTDDIDRLYVSLKEGRGLASIDVYIQIEDSRNTKKSKERRIAAASNSNVNQRTNNKTIKSRKRN